MYSLAGFSLRGALVSPRLSLWVFMRSRGPYIPYRYAKYNYQDSPPLALLPARAPPVYSPPPPPRHPPTGVDAGSQPLARPHGQGLGDSGQVEEVQPAGGLRVSLGEDLELRRGHGGGRGRLSLGFDDDGDGEEEELERREWWRRWRRRLR